MAGCKSLPDRRGGQGCAVQSEDGQLLEFGKEQEGVTKRISRWGLTGLRYTALVFKWSGTEYTNKVIGPTKPLSRESTVINWMAVGKSTLFVFAPFEVYSFLHSLHVVKL